MIVPAGSAADGAGRKIRLAVDIRSAGYEAGQPVIRNVRFTVGAGELVGLIGPNGAGKSTTIKAVLGLLARTDGDIRFGGWPGRPEKAGEPDGNRPSGGIAGCGLPAGIGTVAGQSGGSGETGKSGEYGGAGASGMFGRPGEGGASDGTGGTGAEADARRSGASGKTGMSERSGTPGRSGRYAYVPEHPVFYDYLTLWEHLHLAASAFGMTEEEFVPRAERLLDRFRLLDHRHELPARFSKGMQQKMMLAIGFMLEPELYIVDEPFIGLDPHATRDLLDLLEEERRRGAGILMSTHVLDTAERICDGFVLMHGGTVVARGGLDEVRRQAGLGGNASLFDCFLELTKR